MLILQVVTINVSQIPTAILVNIVARKQLTGIGEMLVVVKAALARFVALTKTVGIQMNVVFLTNVLIKDVLDVLPTQTVVPDITVARKDIGMNLASVVHTVLENLVARSRTVELQMSVVFLTNVHVLIKVVRDVLPTQTAVPDITVARKDIRMNLASVVHTVLENLVARSRTVELQMSVVFLTNVHVLIKVVRDVLPTQTAVPDITVARKDIRMNLASVVHTVLENLVARSRTVEVQMSVVFLTNVHVLIKVVRDVLPTQTAVPDITVARKDIGMNLASVVHTVLENLVVEAMTVVDRVKLVIRIIDAQNRRTLTHDGWLLL